MSSTIGIVDGAALRPAVRVTRDIVYGHGLVHSRSEHPIERPLKLDLYQPAGDVAGQPPRPVLVLAFGGAFHRGSKEIDAFGTPEEGNTSMAEYARLFAERGYVACSIDYRLVQEDPGPGPTRVVQEAARIPRSRVDVVRQMLGLPPADDDMLWRGIEAASDDMAMAARFVLAQAHEWHIDPQRLALGGFSAGARTALNAVYGEQIPAAAVFSLSGYMDMLDLQRFVTRAAGGPPTLLASAQNDLDYIARHTAGMVAHWRAAGIACEQLSVPAAGHFYPADAPAVHDALGRTTVLAALEDFLRRRLAG